MDLRGEELKITCVVPEVGEVPIRCHMGHDVAYAKGQLAQATEIPYGAITFFLNGEMMIDPLSFNDYPAICDLPLPKEIQVQVDVKK